MLFKDSRKLLFDPIKSQTSKQLISVLKGDKSSFGLIAVKTASLNKAFSYPIISLLKVLHPQALLKLNQTKLILKTKS